MGLKIDDRLLEPNGEADITENFNRIMNIASGGVAGRKTQVDFNAILENDTIIATLDETISDFEFISGVEYLIHIYLPLVTLTGDLDDKYKIILRDKDGNDININCVYQNDINETSNVGDLCQIQNYDIGVGYSWTFTGYYRNINDDGKTVRIISTDVIVRESVSSMTGEKLHSNIVNSKLKAGNIVICIADYEYNGSKYEKNHTYLIENESDTEEPMLIATDITEQATQKTIEEDY
jgi:hypothetical protein